MLWGREMSPDAFLPSSHGFVFTNSWPSEPAVVVPTPFGKIRIGNASAGLCGGMVFAALDYWHEAVLPAVCQPTPDQPLYNYLVRRLIDSWHIPTGVTQYYQWMNLPDGDTHFEAFGRRILTEHGLAWRTIDVQWPQVRSDLDHGIPTALGVVTVASNRLRDLGANHQVLAFGYDVSGAEVAVRIYDPNQGQRDDIYIRFDMSTPAQQTTFEHNLGIRRAVRGFFRTAYAPSSPPP
jgi:hypothetical protein